MTGMSMEARVMFAVAALVAASPGNEKEALEFILTMEPNEKQATRIKNMGVTIEQIRHYAKIALEEWERNDAGT